ncbi:hypothetical protein PGT21_011683 [Puccinia graminis f. sp. tritici]|uniref:Uncharacterized protein n=1 Tax=Puccinia graminis f. sp. tritici TaxID=56615 RepID=A0A5B0LIM6_PUCGR|nr:hypothetical protein PGT21_011683 [Puccinia graminis f. sp. tritici]
MPDQELLSCYQEASAFDPLQTQAVLTEWFPQEGDWDLFFLVLEVLKSTHRYWTRDDIPISFAGTWDLPKKQLAQHLVTKMDEMRKSQGYSSLIFDAELHSAMRVSIPIQEFYSTPYGYLELYPPQARNPSFLK